MSLPAPRGPLSQRLLDAWDGGTSHLSDDVGPPDDPLRDDDLHLALYLCYEMSYRGLPGVDDRWEWEPALVGFRRRLEEIFESALRAAVPTTFAGDGIPKQLRVLADSDTGPSLSAYMQSEATMDQFKEFVIHRSAYHLKEADPHSWAIPRLTGKTKAAFIEIQNDEYGSGSWERMHSELFSRLMKSVGLDNTYGAYLDVIPGITLATVNLMSLYGLNRRLRGSVVGHLALFEMTSTIPNRRYGNGLRRIAPEAEARFFDEHVEADAVHEQIAAHDLAGSLVAEDPSMAADVLFGAASLVHLDALFAEHVFAAWNAGTSSLLTRSPSSLVG